MKSKQAFAVLAAAAWIGANEFVRNQLLFLVFWQKHYAHLGTSFPTSPIHGLAWMVWSICFAVVLLIIRTKFTRYQTVGLGWTAGFVLMWLVIGNLNVLPFVLLWAAIPWSILEVAGAVVIIDRLTTTSKASK